MKFTLQQQNAVRTQGRVIVSASAGSGKTTVMIERLIDLILAGKDVSRVLALTFTNKAAAQMREKLRKAVLERLQTAEGSDRAHLKRQLKALPLAEIGTIHAFCGRLVRIYFYALDADPSFRIISPDDAEGKALSRRALNEVFEEAYAEGKEEFLSLLAVYFRKKKDTRLKELVLALYEKVRGSEREKELLSEVGKDYFDAAAEILFHNYRREAERIAKRVKPLLTSLAGNKRAEEVCAAILHGCNAVSSANGLFNITVLACGPHGVPSMPSSAKAEGEKLENLKGLSALSKSFRELWAELASYAAPEEERARYENARARAAALSALTAKYAETYARLKREANVLDYNDLEQYALALLQNEELRSEISARYDYVFVDEYQDVNRVQEAILSKVSRGEVFLVGDAKQAIYGFRGSRSDFFKEKAATLENSLLLSANFRSAPEILRAVNTVFRGLLPGYEEMTGGERYREHTGEVSFHTGLDSRDKEGKQPLSIYSVLAAMRGEKEKKETDPLAKAVVELVKREALEGGVYYDADEGREREVRYGDVAILARKNTGDTERIVRALLQEGIPVSSASKENVCEHFEARLILDWLSYLDNGEQDIPLVSSLLSAVGGFTDAELVAVRMKYPEAETFRAALCAYEAAEDDGIAEKLKEFRAQTERLRDLSRVCNAAETIGELLSLGLEAQIAAKPQGTERLARVRRLCAEAESAGSVHAFLERLNAAEYRVDFTAGGGEDAVKVLTMHAAKGLEFPVVILASMDSPFHGADKDELMWTDELLASPRCYDEENKLTFDTVARRAGACLQRKKELEEEKNLLYVAMTRAKYRLHLMFRESEYRYEPECAKKFAELFCLSKLQEYCVQDPESGKASDPRDVLVDGRGGKYLALLQENYEREYPFESSRHLPVKSSATSVMQGMQGMFDDDMEGGSHSREEGIAYHAFLQYVTFGRSAEEELARMREEGLLSEEQLSLLNVEQLNNILNIPCIRSLEGREVRREQTFLVKLPAREILETDAADEVVFQGAIDLLTRTDEGWLIIDYKYSSHGVEYLKEHYRKQIELYRKAVRKAVKDGLPVSARLVNIARAQEIEM